MKSFLTLMCVLAAVQSIKAACQFYQPEFGGCSRKPAGVSGDKWDVQDKCMTCYCTKIYRTVLECYLPSEENVKATSEMPPLFTVKLEGSLIPISCPFGFRKMPEGKFNAQMLLHYSIFGGWYDQTCCGKTQPVEWPEHCEVKRGPDGCSFEIVLKADNSKPCDGNIAVSG